MNHPTTAEPSGESMSLAIDPTTYQQIARAYFAMLSNPAVDLDGWRSPAQYVKDFRRQEDDDQYDPGCCDYLDRPAMVYLYEAMRQMCGTNYAGAFACVQLAADHLDARTGQEARPCLK